MPGSATNHTETQKDAARGRRSTSRRPASGSRASRSDTPSSQRKRRPGTGQQGRRPKPDRPKGRPLTDKQRHLLALRRAKALDGVGGIAILGVLGYHLGLPWLAGGHLGLVMLLVLSGYLLTSSQLGKIRKGIGGLPRLWAQIVSNVWPPLAIVTTLTVVACMFVFPDMLPSARVDVLPSLALIENLSYTLRGVTPFGEGATASPLAHLWYLGLYAQFCLLWPLVMQVNYAVLPSRTAARRLTLALAVTSAIGMGLFFGSGSGVSHAFYGLDTRAFAPLLGAWLAYVAPLGKRPARDVRPFVQRSRLVIEITGIVALFGLLVGMILAADSSPLPYRGGMFLAALSATSVVAAITMSGGLLSRALSARPLQWLGSRSLSIYLWHFPLFRLFDVSAARGNWLAIVAVLALSLVLAELSHQFLGSIARSHDAREAEKGSLVGLGREPVAVASPIVAAMVAVSVCAFSGNVSLALVFDAEGVTTEASSPNVQESTDGQSGDETAAAPDNATAEGAAESATSDEQTADAEAKEDAEAPSEDQAHDESAGASSTTDQAQAKDESDKQTANQFEEIPGLPRVLIIGNSFTFFNDLPSLLSANLGTKVSSETKESAHLSEHLNPETQQGAATLARLDDGHWDYVVIQEMSAMPIDDKEQYLSDLSTLVDLVRERDAKPIIYATWAYNTGRWGAEAHDMTVQEMHDALQASFQEASELTGAPIANVGQAFADTGFDPSLYDDDGKHPSEKGSQLAADIIEQVIMESWESEE